MGLNDEFRPNVDFSPWGPFVPANYVNMKVVKADILIASIAGIISLVCAGYATWLVYKQMISSRSPLRSMYIWMIWTELGACLIMGIICYLHLFKIIRPNFYFYMTILFCWCVQVQLLLQIIINRIRVIVPDRRRSKMIMVTTAAIVTVINISVFCIWVPARMQVNENYVLINSIWDRIEKVIYLIMDAALNWYFLKVVKANLINNGLQKYDRLFRFNQRIILLSLLMDVMIIAAMSIPNSFVYVQFHPFAYLVKLNIEMIMANLIKRIAISTSKRTGNVSIIQEFASDSNKSSSGATGAQSLGTRPRHKSDIELASGTFPTKHTSKHGNDRIVSFVPMGNQIKRTEEIHVKSEPNPDFAPGSEWMGKSEVVIVGQSEIGKSRSLDDVTEGGSVKSLKSEEQQRREDSDDEAVLVRESKGGWRHLPG